MKKIILAVSIIFMVAACGAKTKPELMAEAKLHEEYTVNKNYQVVYRGIADKFVECSYEGTQYIQRNLYPELGEGDMVFNAGGYLFLVNIKKNEENSTHISAYSKFTTGYYPLFMGIARMGAFGQEGCPK